MSGKLDQSLDQIMQDSGSTGRRRAGRPRTNRRAAQKAKAAIAAPTGGVKKNTKAPATAGKAPAMAAPKRPAGDSKIIINGLPEDVGEKDLKNFIDKAAAPCKRVIVTYGPNGRSRGIATVIFADAAAAAKASKSIDGVKIDNRPLKVEHVFSDAAATPAPKTLADRMSKPKSAAKEAKAAPKGKAAAPATNGPAAKGKNNAKGKKAGNAGRPKKKTADELDAEMMDYFGGDSAAAAATNGAAQPATAAAATNGAEPVDEVM